MAEDLEIDLLHLKAALIFDRSPRTEDRGSFAAEVGMKEQSRLGERSFQGQTRSRSGGSSPSGRRRRGPPSMILEVRLPSHLLDAPELPRREPVGMKRAIEHLERQVGDPRSPEANTHAQHVLSGH